MPVEPLTLVQYLVAVSALVLSPGPDTALILRYTITSGLRVGFATVAGVQIGLTVHTLLAVLGVSLLIASSPTLFRAVAVAGALYLGWLGWQGLRGGGVLAFGRTPSAVGAVKGCRDAVLTNLLNPKVILLFLALLPNFVDTGRPGVSRQLAFLGTVLIVVNTLWQSLLAWSAERVRRWFERPAIGRWVSIGTGIALLLIAASILSEHVVSWPATGDMSPWSD
jgi:threonine/homoserine/homoserine lactone efflux protein